MGSGLHSIGKMGSVSYNPALAAPARVSEKIPPIVACKLWAFGTTIAQIRKDQEVLARLRAGLGQEQATATRASITKAEFFAAYEASAAGLQTNFETQLTKVSASIQQLVATFRGLSSQALQCELNALAKQIPLTIMSIIESWSSQPQGQEPDVS